MTGARAMAEKIEAVFGKIAAERMRDVPICNPRLRVEAHGMQAWQGGWLCVLVTPWFMNIVVLPGGAGTARNGETVFHDLPAGRFPFIAGEEEGLGPLHSCSLFSPVLEFLDHDTAVETAKAALAEVMTDARPETADNPSRRALLGLGAAAAEEAQ
jgi:[NiFe] hydrogenase assembly HybE family chaperone